MLIKPSKEQQEQLRKRLTELFGPPKKQSALDRVLHGTGVGSQLWRLLEELGIKHTAICLCLDWAERMNSWGPIGCRLARPGIISHLESSAKNYGWLNFVKAATMTVISGLVFKINPLDPYGSLLDEAIRRAEQHGV